MINRINLAGMNTPAKLNKAKCNSNYTEKNAPTFLKKQLSKETKKKTPTSPSLLVNKQKTAKLLEVVSKYIK